MANKAVGMGFIEDILMDIADIYDKFDQIGCLTFATIDDGYPQTRIAHLFAHDHEGLYFRTMITKAFGCGSIAAI